MADYPNIYIHMSRKINLGNYESAEVTVGLSGVPADADEALIEQMMGTAKLGFNALRVCMEQKVKEAKDSGGWNE